MFLSILSFPTALPFPHSVCTAETPAKTITASKQCLLCQSGEWTVSQSSPLMYSLHSHKPSEEDRRGRGGQNTVLLPIWNCFPEQQGWTIANHVLSSNQRRLTSRFPFRLYIVSSLWIWAHRYFCKEKGGNASFWKTSGLSENSLLLQTEGQQRNCIGVCIKMLGTWSQVPESLWAKIVSLSLGAC